MKKIILLLSIFAFCSNCLIALNTETYFPYIARQKTFGSSKQDYFSRVQKTNDGGYILSGISRGGISGDKTDTLDAYSDYWIIKTDSNFTMQWQKTLGKLGFSEGHTGTGYLYNLGVTAFQTPDNGYIVVGSLGYDFLLIKLNNNGDTLWKKVIGDTLRQETITDFKITRDSGFIIGATNSGGGAYGITKLSKTGMVQWQKNYAIGSHNNVLLSVQQTADNGYILAGETYQSAYKSAVVKVNDTGGIQWQKIFSAPSREPYANEVAIQSIKQTFDGGYIFAANIGQSQYGFDPYSDFWVVKTDASGNIQYSRIIRGNDTDGQYDGDLDIGLDMDIIQTLDSNYIVAGTSVSGVADDKNEIKRGPSNYTTNGDAWILKLDKRLNTMWQKTIGGDYDENFRNILEIRKDEFVLGMQSNSGIGGDKTEPSRGYEDYWVVKLKIIDRPDTIQGKLFSSAGSTCVPAPGDRGIQNIVIKTEPSVFYALTNNEGNYKLLTGHDTYKVKPLIPAYLNTFTNSNAMCPAAGYHIITMNSANTDTSGINFSRDIASCPLLKVTITQNRLRYCTQSLGILTYSNQGIADTNHVKVYLEIPESLNFISADRPYTTQGRQIIFDIDTLRANESGTIRYVVIACSGGTSLGSTNCIKAWILPKNKCYKQMQPNYNNWDGSELEIAANCVVNTARFTIYNRGNNMADSSSYKLFIDATFALTKKFKINAGDSLVINFPTPNARTYRLEAAQRPYFPGNATIYATLEACGIGVASRGIVTQMETTTPNIDVVQLCLTVFNSFDPNDKTVNPTGVGADKRVRHGVPLNYTINFQNTGNDTAYKVVLTDTLSMNFDLSTLVFGASSHPYKVDFIGRSIPILRFTFNNINLVDSITNEPKSHGFVTFSVKPYDTIPNATKIYNNADIYFDFNPPIRTNTTLTTINDTVFSGAKIVAVSAGIDKTVCLGDSITLTANGADSYVWNNGSISSSIRVLPNLGSNNVYIVTGTIGAFSNKDTVRITAVSKPTVNAGSDVSICVGQSTVLSATYQNAVAFSWSTGSSSSSISVSPVSTSSYIATVKATQDVCIIRDTVKVTVNPLPDPFFTRVINGTTVQFNTVNSYPSYFWRFGDGATSTLQNPSHTYAATGIYYASLTVNNSFNCSAVKRDTFNLIITAVNNTISFADKIEVYPNPADDEATLFIKSNKTATFTIRLSDVSGKVITTKVFKSVSTVHDKIDLSAVSSGIYFLQIQSENESAVYRLMKK